MALLGSQETPQMVFGTQSPRKVGVVTAFLTVGIVDVEFSNIFFY